MVGAHITASEELQAVVRFNDCSGVLVRPDVLVTSAHCLGPANKSITVLGHSYGLAHCEAHPGYVPIEPQHDVAFCRLSTTTPVRGIPLNDGTSLEVGTAVTLAGYGRSKPFAHDGGVLRVVDTVVASVGKSSVLVGTDGQTACLGDSGGPVLVKRGSQGYAVAGILHGGSGAICASPTEMVPMVPQQAWLIQAAGLRSHPHLSGLIVWAAGLAVLAEVVLLLRRRFQRSRINKQTARLPETQ